MVATSLLKLASSLVMSASSLVMVETSLVLVVTYLVMVETSLVMVTTSMLVVEVATMSTPHVGHHVLNMIFSCMSDTMSPIMLATGSTSCRPPQCYLDAL